MEINNEAKSRYLSPSWIKRHSSTTKPVAVRLGDPSTGRITQTTKQSAGGATGLINIELSKAAVTVGACIPTKGDFKEFFQGYNIKNRQ